MTNRNGLQGLCWSPTALNQSAAQHLKTASFVTASCPRLGSVWAGSAGPLLRAPQATARLQPSMILSAPGDSYNGTPVNISIRFLGTGQLTSLLFAGDQLGAALSSQRPPDILAPWPSGMATHFSKTSGCPCCSRL